MVAITFELNWGVIWTALVLSAIYGTVKLLRQTVTLTYVKKAVSVARHPFLSKFKLVAMELADPSVMIYSGLYIHSGASLLRWLFWTVLIHLAVMRYAQFHLRMLKAINRSAAFHSNAIALLMQAVHALVPQSLDQPILLSLKIDVAKDLNDEVLHRENRKDLRLAVYYLFSTTTWLIIATYFALIKK